MSEENVEIVREAMDAFNRRDRAAFLAFCDPDYENVPPRDWPESAPTRGREAVWDFFVQAQEPWGERTFELGEVIDAASDKLVAHQRSRMRGTASGADVVFSYWHVISIRDGKVVRSEWFTDRAEALEAAGMPE
jgi:ketosteroid isomerase-like protein